MPLPELIEILPLVGPIKAEISVPGSKSITNRALILAALAPTPTSLVGALWSEDTQVMVEGLRQLGFEINVARDPAEMCNRTITVQGLAGRIPRSGTVEKPLELFVGNAGTTARFLAALVCLGKGSYRLQGVPRMHERPQEALFQSLRVLGYHIESPNNKLPAVIHGTGPKAGYCQVSIEESSQFASALLLCARVGGWNVKVIGENSEESPYVAMTTTLVEGIEAAANGQSEASAAEPVSFFIEPDASSASYFWALSWLLQEQGLSIQVLEESSSRLQIDRRFQELLPLPGVVSRQRDLGDSIMTAIVLAPFARAPVRFVNLARLRVQECDRVVALRDELRRCGATVEMNSTGEELQVTPSRLQGAEIRTYNDHRMAMCFAVLALKVPGIRIQNPSCVKKTFPDFFQKLGGAPPKGLGAAILNATTGRRLGMEELFAE